MFTLKVGDWVIPTAGLLPIDSEQQHRTKERRSITTTEPLQIESIPVTKKDEEQLKFQGIRGQFLACFFQPVNKTAITMQGNDQGKQNILSLIKAHGVQKKSPTIEVEVVVNGRTFTLLGSKEQIVDMGLTSVVLLSPESTPDNFISATTAPKEFELALGKLVTGGTKFYTVLQSSWALPAFIWEICP